MIGDGTRAPSVSGGAGWADLMALAAGALAGHRLRSVLSALGIAIGIGSVVLLTSIGEGTRRYILDQFTQFGTRVVVVVPGKSETIGIPGVLGGTTHKLTLEQAEMIARLPEIEAAMPLAVGQARVEAGSRGRSVIVHGVTPAISRVWSFRPRQGSFWSRRDPRVRTPYAVLGPTLARELFDDDNPLGRFVHIAGHRFRVIGVMEPKGQLLGIDLGDTVYIPVAVAMEIFNLEEPTEIDAIYREGVGVARAERAIRRLMIEQHDGREDFEIVTQEAMLSVFGNVMRIITLAVGAIAGISLLVGAVGILTMMWIAVGERTAEIGLARAVGATRTQVLGLFLAEASLLGLAGGLLGLASGYAALLVLRLALPGLPVHTPPVYVALALAVSVGTGLAAGTLPARRAAILDPIEALRAE